MQIGFFTHFAYQNLQRIIFLFKKEIDLWVYLFYFIWRAAWVYSKSKIYIFVVVL